MNQNKAFNETKSEKETSYYQSDDCKIATTGFQTTDDVLISAICPNCGARLEGRKCKLLCPTLGCGYMVTCSEW